MSTPEKLPANQARAIEALLTGSNQQEAALAAGVVDRTLRRWLIEPAFTNELNTQKMLALGAATARLVGSMDAAITVINDILAGVGDKKRYQATQLRAAKIALDAALKLVELNDILARIEALEAANEQR